MDPFSSDGELVNVHTAFIQGQYQSVLDDYTPSDFSASNHLPVRILQGRAQCALHNPSAVLSSISDSESKSSPDLAALRLYASYLSNPTPTLPPAASTLATTHSTNLTVQLLIGTLLTLTNQPDAALSLLSNHTGSLDAVALIIQIHLSQNRVDLATKEARSARSFAQDALLVNLAESWIGMRAGGNENYQKAFYVFEELAQGPSSAAAGSLVSQAVSELHMGRVEEAEVALGQALALEPGNAAGLANKVVLDTVLGRNSVEGVEALRGVEKGHELLVEMDAKREAFRAAMAKYNPKFEP